jgi:CheY-like chemotaxis protein
MMSGLNRPHVRERAFRAGAEAFLPKPIAPAELLQVLVHGRPPSALHEAGGEESELGRSASM